MMGRKLFMGGFGVSLVAAVVVGVSMASASAGSGAHVWGAPAGMVHFSKVAQGGGGTSGGSTITVVSRHVQETDVDEPPSGFSQGDETTTSSPLFDTAGNHVGHVDVHGAITARFADTARGQFEFTATLKRGTITATGVALFSAQASGFTA